MEFFPKRHVFQPEGGTSRKGKVKEEAAKGKNRDGRDPAAHSPVRHVYPQRL